MEGPQRGRSSSAGHHPNHHMNHSPSPHQFQDHSSRLDLDSSLGAVAFTSGLSSTDITASTHSNNLQYNYLDDSSRLQHFDPQPLPGDHFNGQDLDPSFQPNGIATELQHSPSSLDIQHSSGHPFSSELLASDTSSGFGDFSHHQDITRKQGQSFDSGFLIDPDIQGEMQPQHQSINPADLMSNMSSPQNLIPTPPNLIPPESTSPRGGSPVPHQSQIYSPNHSRHTSLDPSSAIFPHGQPPADWSSMLQQHQFQTHRRAPSEHSDVSSSVAPSPYLAQQDGFDTFDQNTSPMLTAQQDYQDALGIERFTLSDPQQQQQQQQRMSPRHSPFVSPLMSPQPGLGPHGLSLDNNNFMLSQEMRDFTGGPGPEIYNDQPDNFSQFGARHGSGGDLGQAAQMAPPEINVEYAPATRQSSFDPPRPETDLDALSPPESSQSLYTPPNAPRLTQLTGRRGRMRAKSDPNLSRPVSPGVNAHAVSSLDATLRQRSGSLSPYDTSPNHSRDPSPASKTSRRSSTPNIPSRDYILELADPSRPAASGTDKRIQKHPATFQCTLCPKRFTRAYNLRSHLRTHTDERPFVCTVCGKAFARQHDRKRHEGLHSGEKKFVCKGELGTGGNWGCGRRFARADALGRHFRSEAGRICIKPLLDEEAIERQRVYDEQMMGQSQNMHTAAQVPGSNPLMINGGGTGSGFTLPAALLLQYPALQGLQWDQLGATGQGDEGELSGRSSFDASSQGEYFDDEDVEYGSGTGGGEGSRWGLGGGGGEWASDYEGR